MYCRSPYGWSSGRPQDQRAVAHGPVVMGVRVFDPDEDEVRCGAQLTALDHDHGTVAEAELCAVIADPEPHAEAERSAEPVARLDHVTIGKLGHDRRGGDRPVCEHELLGSCVVDLVGDAVEAMPPAGDDRHLAGVWVLGDVRIGIRRHDHDTRDGVAVVSHLMRTLRSGAETARRRPRPARDRRRAWRTVGLPRSTISSSWLP